MICKVCEKVLDLDVSLPVETVVGQELPITHHDSYPALSRAAQTGCKFCQLVVEIYQQSGYETPFSLPQDPRFQVSMKFSHDSIEVTIPVPICYDESEQDLSSQSYDIAEHNIKLYISTEYNDALAEIFSMRPLSEDSSSDGCFKAGFEWLQSCLDTHEDCPKHISPLPSRVIDVGSDTTEPFLYISKGEHGSWLALSHCWGLKPILRTASDTLRPFTQKVPMGDLPQTFKDAILITRKLGYRYIWIDSLCIIQDSREDWEAESKKMAMIYQNAVASISADAAAGDHEGIFQGVKNQRQTFKRTALPCGSEKRGLSGTIFVSVREGRHISKAMPLQTRAWVLQEKALSVRMLHYQHTGLDWRCQTATSTEIRPGLVQDLNVDESIHKIAHKRLPANIDFTIKSYQDKSEFSALSWWYSQITDYTARQITYTSDRFPAIAGLAKAFSNGTGYHYKAGIWEEDFRRGLLWKGTVPESYRGLGPSWSWVGVVSSQWSGSVYQPNMFLTHGRKYAAELVGFSEPTAADAYLGGGGATILTLRGWCKEARDFVGGQSFYPDHVFSQQNPMGDQTGSFRTQTAMPVLKNFPTSQNGRGEDMVVFWPDKEFNPSAVTAIPLPENAIILCISEFEAWDPSSPHVLAIWAMMLEPTDSNAFRRVGLVRIPSDKPSSFNEGFDLRTIRIS